MSERRFDLQSKKAPLVEKRRKALRRRLSFSLVFLVVLFGILAALSNLHSLQITEVKISGNQVTSERDIRQIVKRELSGRYVYLFPKSNAFLFPKRQIEKSLMYEIKRISEVKIEHENVRELDIVVSEREGTHLWCGNDETTLLSEDENIPCYFVDETGYVFSKAPFFSGTVYFRLYGAPEGFNTENPLGSRILSEADFSKILFLKKELSELELVPVGLHIKENGEYEMLLLPATWGKGIPRVIFLPSADPELLIHDLESALITDPLKTDIKEKYSTLEYLDLRYENRVFYKFGK